MSVHATIHLGERCNTYMMTNIYTYYITIKKVIQNPWHAFIHSIYVPFEEKNSVFRQISSYPALAL